MSEWNKIKLLFCLNSFLKDNEFLCYIFLLSSKLTQAWIKCGIFADFSMLQLYPKYCFIYTQIFAYFGDYLKRANTQISSNMRKSAKNTKYIFGFFNVTAYSLMRRVRYISSEHADWYIIICPLLVYSARAEFLPWLELASSLPRAWIIVEYIICFVRKNEMVGG